VAVAARVTRAAAAVGRVMGRIRESAHVRAAAKVLAAGVAVLVLARAGAARRAVALIDRARSAMSDGAAAAWTWVRGIRLLPAAA
jgi:hypothetical protein